MTAAAALSWLGIAKETTKGTPVQATDTIPAKTMQPNDAITYLADTGMRGSMTANYGETQAAGHSTYDFSGDVFPSIAGFMFAGILGDITTTGSSAPFTHAMALKNTGDGQPSGYTLSDYDGYNVRQFAGCQFSEVGLKWTAAGLLEYTAKTEGFLSVIEGGSPPALSFDTAAPTGAWTGVTKVAGSSILNSTDGELTLKRTLAVINTVDGLQSPYKIFGGPVEVTGKFTTVMEDETQLAHYLTNDQPALDFTWSAGTGAGLTSIDLHMSKVAYTGGQIVRGKEYIEVPVDWTAIANLTDPGASAGYSPCKVTVENARPSGTF